jgi:ketosteroid isomerase-like protein
MSGAALALSPHAPARLRSPESALAAFAEAIGAGDLSAASGCLGRDACLVTPDSTAVRGREAIRPVLAQMILAGTRIEAEIAPLLVAGDLALGRGLWRTLLTDAMGAPYAQTSTSTVVLKKVEQDTWKLQILAPWERR